MAAYKERLAAKANLLYSEEEVNSDDRVTKVTFCRGGLGYPVDESKGMPLEPWELKQQ